MDGIEVGFGEEERKEEPSFCGFMYMKGDMRRRDVHEDTWANRILAGCSRRQRRQKKGRSVNDISERA